MTISQPRIRVFCPVCREESVTRDANASWSITTQQWETASVFDDGYCGTCEQSIKGWETEPVKLPADPDGMNDKRSDWAHGAIAHFEKTTGTDREDALSDLLGDLMHWADRNQTDFETELARARGHYADETLGDAPAPSADDKAAAVHVDAF